MFDEFIKTIGGEMTMYTEFSKEERDWYALLLLQTPRRVHVHLGKKSS